MTCSQGFRGRCGVWVRGLLQSIIQGTGDGGLAPGHGREKVRGDSKV